MPAALDPETPPWSPLRGRGIGADIRVFDTFPRGGGAHYAFWRAHAVISLRFIQAVLKTNESLACAFFCCNFIQIVCDHYVYVFFVPAARLADFHFSTSISH